MKFIKTILLITTLVVINNYSFAIDSLLSQQGNIESFYRHHKKITFDVYGGNCKTCKRSIEKVVRKMNGIESVDWNAKQQKVTIVYDPMVVDPDDMREVIVKYGFDTDTLKATKEAYGQLEDCCKYTRQYP